MTAPLDGGNASSTFAQPSGLPAPDLTGALFSPTLTTATARTPYLTSQEFLEAGTGVDTSQLIPNGSTAANAAALTRVIARASAWADSLCYKTLAPTVDVQAGRYRVYDGQVRIPLKMTPVIAVQWVSLGSTPYQLAALPSLQQAALTPPGLLTLAAPCGTLGGWGRPGFYQVSYVNGYGACTTLAGSAAVGDTWLNLATNLGVAPGMVLTVDDGANSEQVTVATGYTPGATGTVPIANPCQYAHPAGVAVSAMPQDIKQAVIALTACLIKTRGSEAMVMGSLTSEPTGTALSEAGGIEDFEVATDLLERYRRVW